MANRERARERRSVSERMGGRERGQRVFLRRGIWHVRKLVQYVLDCITGWWFICKNINQRLKMNWNGLFFFCCHNYKKVCGHKHTPLPPSPPSPPPPSSTPSLSSWSLLSSSLEWDCSGPFAHTGNLFTISVLLCRIWRTLIGFDWEWHRHQHRKQRTRRRNKNVRSISPIKHIHFVGDNRTERNVNVIRNCFHISFCFLVNFFCTKFAINIINDLRHTVPPNEQTRRSTWTMKHG